MKTDAVGFCAFAKPSNTFKNALTGEVFYFSFWKI
jgi:hypothetical protein